MPNSRVYRRKDVKDQSVWWARWKDTNGTWQRKSSGLTDRKAAEQWLTLREREVVSPTPRRETASFSSALEAIITEPNIGHATKRMYTHRAERVMETLGDFDLHRLTEADVLKHIHRRLEIDKVSRSTVFKEWLTIKRAADKVKAPVQMPAFSYQYVPRKRWLSIKEYRALLMRLDDRHRMWFVLACYTGGRYAEVCRLDWSDIDFEQGIVWLRGTKTTGSDRFVPLPPELRQALLMYGAKTKGLIVGPWPKVNRDLNVITKRLGMDHVSPNDLRRTYASWLRNRGVPLDVISHLLGHAPGSKMVALTYGRLSHETLMNTAGMLPQLPPKSDD